MLFAAADDDPAGDGTGSGGAADSFGGGFTGAGRNWTLGLLAEAGGPGNGGGLTSPAFAFPVGGGDVESRRADNWYASSEDGEVAAQLRRATGERLAFA